MDFFLGKFEKQTCFPSLSVKTFSPSSFLSGMFCQCVFLHNPECPLSPCFDCPRPIRLSKPCVFRCQLSHVALPHPQGRCLHTFRMLLETLHVLEVVPSTSVLPARLSGQCLTFSQFHTESFSHVVFNNIGSREFQRAPMCSDASVFCG